jgi:hypothetical protein
MTMVAAPAHCTWRNKGALFPLRLPQNTTLVLHGITGADTDMMGGGGGGDGFLI